MRRAPDRQLAFERYEQLAPGYERRHRLLRTLFQESLRREAVAGLCLERGETVLDVGCGTGASFALLEEAIGPRGHLIGIDQSRAMLERARYRAEQAGWRNTSLIEASAEDAVVGAVADAALFFFTHDILQSAEAVTNVLRAVKPGGRVVAAGGKRGRWWLLPINLAWWLIARPYITTLRGAGEPWRLLVPRLVDLDVQARVLALLYIAGGRRGVEGAATSVGADRPASNGRDRRLAS